MKRNITIYYITRVFVGLRFIIPIWVTFFLRIITFEQLALAETISIFIGMMFELPSGVLADLIGRRITVALGFIIHGIAYSLISQASNFGAYLLFFSIGALGESFVSGAEEALVYDTLKENKALEKYSKVKSIEAMIYRITLLLSTIVGGYIYKIRIYLPYLLTGLTMIVAGLIYVFAKEPAIDTKKFTLKGYLSDFKLGFLESFKNKSTTLVSIYYVLIFSAAFILMGYFEQPYSKWLGLTEIQIGWVFGILTLIKIFTVLLAPRIEKSIKPKLIHFFLPFLTGIFLIFSFRNIFWGITILLIENIILAYRFIFTQKLYNAQIHSRYRASALSTLSMFTNGLYITCVYFLSKFLNFDSIGFSFNIIGIIFIIAAFLSLKFQKYDRIEDRVER